MIDASQWPEFRSHKVVRAVKVIAVEGWEIVRGIASYRVLVEGFAGAVEVPASVFARGVPSPGDYLVAYDGGAYLSWSPARSFEEGYTPIERDAFGLAPLEPEPPRAA